jgi:hypothetical protein
MSHQNVTIGFEECTDCAKSQMTGQDEGREEQQPRGRKQVETNEKV